MIFVIDLSFQNRVINIGKKKNNHNNNNKKTPYFLRFPSDVIGGLVDLTDGAWLEK